MLLREVLSRYRKRHLPKFLPATALGLSARRHFAARASYRGLPEAETCRGRSLAFTATVVHNGRIFALSRHAVSRCSLREHYAKFAERLSTPC
jgi:hypothetical protein